MSSKPEAGTGNRHSSIPIESFSSRIYLILSDMYDSKSASQSMSDSIETFQSLQIKSRVLHSRLQGGNLRHQLLELIA